MLEFNPLLNQIEQLGRKSTLLNEDIRRQLIQDILLKATSHVHLAHFLLDIEKCQPLESYLDLLSDRALNLQRELIKPKILPEDSDEFQLLEKKINEYADDLATALQATLVIYLQHPQFLANYYSLENKLDSKETHVSVLQIGTIALSILPSEYSKINSELYQRFWYYRDTKDLSKEKNQIKAERKEVFLLVKQVLEELCLLLKYSNKPMPSVAENYQVFCSLTPSQRGPATMGLPRLPAVDHNADHCSLAMTHSQEPKIQTLMQFSKILQFEDPVTKERYSEQGFQNALQAFDHALEKAKISPSLIAILQNHSFIAASDRTNHILLQSLEKTLAVTVYAANRRLQWQAEANNQLSITEIVYLYVSPKDIQMSNTSQGQQPLLVITNQYRLRVVQDEIKVSVSLSQFMLHQSVVTNLTKVNESADFLALKLWNFYQQHYGCRNFLLDQSEQALVTFIDVSAALNTIVPSEVKDLQQQTALLNAMSGISYVVLKLDHCEALTDDLLMAMVKSSPNLVYLNVSHCPNITEKMLPILEQYCPQLRQLNMSFTGVKKFAKDTLGVLSVAVKLPHLQQLDLQNTAVSIIKLKAFQLTTLDLENCQQLKELELNAKQLHTVNFDGCLHLVVDKRYAAIYRNRDKDVQDLFHSVFPPETEIVLPDADINDNNSDSVELRQYESTELRQAIAAVIYQNQDNIASDFAKALATSIHLLSTRERYTNETQQKINAYAQAVIRFSFTTIQYRNLVRDVLVPLLVNTTTQAEDKLGVYFNSFTGNPYFIQHAKDLQTFLVFDCDSLARLHQGFYPDKPSKLLQSGRFAREDILEGLRRNIDNSFQDAYRSILVPLMGLNFQKINQQFASMSQPEFREFLLQIIERLPLSQLQIWFVFAKFNQGNNDGKRNDVFFSEIIGLLKIFIEYSLKIQLGIKNYFDILPLQDGSMVLNQYSEIIKINDKKYYETYKADPAAPLGVLQASFRLSSDLTLLELSANVYFTPAMQAILPLRELKERMIREMTQLSSGDLSLLDPELKFFKPDPLYAEVAKRALKNAENNKAQHVAETLFMLYKQNRQIYFHLPDANDAVHVSLPEKPLPSIASFFAVKPIDAEYIPFVFLNKNSTAGLTPIEIPLQPMLITSNEQALKTVAYIVNFVSPTTGHYYHGFAEDIVTAFYHDFLQCGADPALLTGLQSHLLPSLLEQTTALQKPLLEAIFGLQVLEQSLSLQYSVISPGQVLLKAMVKLHHVQNNDGTKQVFVNDKPVLIFVHQFMLTRNQETVRLEFVDSHIAVQQTIVMTNLTQPGHLLVPYLCSRLKLLEPEAYDVDWLKAMQVLVRKLVHEATMATVLEDYYRLLPEELRSHLIDVLTAFTDENDNNNSAILQHWSTKLAAVPNNLGWRQQERLVFNRLFSQIEKITQADQPDTDSYVTLEYPDNNNQSVKCYLKPELVDTILNVKKNGLRSTDTGHKNQHIVLHLNNVNGVDLFLKERPNRPAMSYAILILMLRLLGEGAPAQTLAKMTIHYPKKSPRVIPILISETVKGMTLQQSMQQQNTELFPNPRSYALMAFFDIFAKAGDSHFGNIIVDAKGNLTNVDADVYLESDATDDHDGINSCLFVFPEKMQQDSRPYLEFLLAIDFDLLSYGWSSTILPKIKSFSRLFTLNELSSINAENHSLPFTPDLYLETGLAWLKVGFLRTQNLLATRNTLSLQEIFDELNQKASTFWQKRAMAQGAPLRRYLGKQILPQAMMSIQSVSKLWSLTQKKTFSFVEATKDFAVFSPYRPAENIIAGHDHANKFALFADFSKLSAQEGENQSARFIKIMSSHNYNKLKISNCDWLTDKTLKQILAKSTHLSLLDLQNCPNVSQEGIHFVLEKFNSLRMLYLNNIGIERLIGVMLDEQLQLKRLKILHIRNCQITMVQFDALHLRELKIQACPNLDLLKIHVPSLKQVDISNCEKVQIKHKPLMQYYPYIVSHSIQQSLAQFIDNNYVKNQFKGATGFDDFSKRLKESFDKAEDLAKNARNYFEAIKKFRENLSNSAVLAVGGIEELIRIDAKYSFSERSYPEIAKGMQRFIGNYHSLFNELKKLVVSGVMTNDACELVRKIRQFYDGMPPASQIETDCYYMAWALDIVAKKDEASAITAFQALMKQMSLKSTSESNCIAVVLSMADCLNNKKTISILIEELKTAKYPINYLRFLAKMVKKFSLYEFNQLYQVFDYSFAQPSSHILAEIAYIFMLIIGKNKHYQVFVFDLIKKLANREYDHRYILLMSAVYPAIITLMPKLPISSLHDLHDAFNALPDSDAATSVIRIRKMLCEGLPTEELIQQIARLVRVNYFSSQGLKKNNRSLHRLISATFAKQKSQGMQIDIKELLLSLRKAALKADFECRKSLITLVVLCQHESNQRLPFELFAQLNSKNMEMYGLFLQFFLELSSVSTLGHLFSAYGDQKDYSEEPIFLLNILLGLIDFHLEKIKVNNASPRFDIDRILTTFFNAYNYEAGIIDIQKLCVLKQTDDDFISIAYLFSYFLRAHQDSSEKTRQIKKLIKSWFINKQVYLSSLAEKTSLQILQGLYYSLFSAWCYPKHQYPMLSISFSPMEDVRVNHQIVEVILEVYQKDPNIMADLFAQLTSESLTDKTPYLFMLYSLASAFNEVKLTVQGILSDNQFLKTIFQQSNRESQFALLIILEYVGHKTSLRGLLPKNKENDNDIVFMIEQLDKKIVSLKTDLFAPLPSLSSKASIAQQGSGKENHENVCENNGLY